MTKEAFAVRCFLTVVVVVVSIMLFLPMLAVKVIEGVYFCYALTKDSINQVWSRRTEATRMG